MSLDDKVSAAAILRRSGMIDDPGYYSGSGARLSYLDDAILEKVYKGVLDHHGKAAAREFVELVGGMPKLAATDFILAFYRLEANNWRFDKAAAGQEKGVYASNNAQAFATLMGAFGGMMDWDDTDLIRNPFLERHIEEYRRKGIDENGKLYFRKL